MSFWRTSRLSDGRISFSQASTGGKNNPLPPYDTILPPTGIHPKWEGLLSELEQPYTEEALTALLQEHLYGPIDVETWGLE
jgi:hypothetical protein